MFVRLLRPALVALGALTLVTACAGSSGAPKPTTSTTAQAASLDGVTVSGAVGKAPTVTLSKTPFSVATALDAAHALAAQPSARKQLLALPPGFEQISLALDKTAGTKELP